MNDDRFDVDVAMGESWVRRQEAEIVAARKRREGARVHPDARAIVRWAFEDPQDRKADE